MSGTIADAVALAVERRQRHQHDIGNEFGGGLLLAFGLFTPFAAATIVAGMLVAIATTHWRNGFWNGAGGYEFNLLILTGILVVLAIFMLLSVLTRR